MKLSFNVNYRTLPGQDLFVTGDVECAMKYLSDGNWSAEADVPQGRTVRYSYILKDISGGTVRETGAPHAVTINKGCKKITVNDQWQGNGPQAPFLTEPFAGVRFGHKCAEAAKAGVYPREIVFCVTSPLVEKDAQVLVCGSCEQLGDWDPMRALPMTAVNGCRWSVNINAASLIGHIEYKFIKKTAAGEIIWEPGANRSLEVPSLEERESLIAGSSMSLMSDSLPRMAGTAVPVFSLRSEGGAGIGDFLDIKLLCDWAASTGQGIVQLLPVNDTTSTRTWTDSYPYAGITIMALNPVYMNLKSLGTIADRKLADRLDKEAKRLNELPQIDYEAVLALKSEYFRAIYAQDGAACEQTDEYKTFVEANREWLYPYAAFCTLRDKYGTAVFSQWGKDSVYSDKLVEKLRSQVKAGASIRYYIFLQFHLDRQLREAHEYAHSKGISIKGDIPIGITPRSVEAWKEPQFFNMDAQAGAPPDDFSVNGQNWGFPTYNWEVMAQDGYSWWKKRFTKMAEYFDAYRIDHVLGFFRIWEVPADQVYGLMGHFNPAMPFTVGEMAGYGFHFDFCRHATPFIRQWQLQEVFGKDCEAVKGKFLDSCGEDAFALKAEFGTQKKIEAFFEGETAFSADVREGLMGLVSELLFVEDQKAKGKFHPRISAQSTCSFRCLPQDQKDAFNRLYEDFFYRRHNDFWKAGALQKLPALIASTGMLCCAEDLGMIPACVPEVLDSLQVLTLEVQRMPKDISVRLGDPARYPYRCVCTTGSHDTSSLRGWLEEEGEQPTVYRCEQIVREHLASPAMLTILPLQDWCSTYGTMIFTPAADERINVPANPRHYWRFRLPYTLEYLNSRKDFAEHIKSLIEASGR